MPEGRETEEIWGRIPSNLTFSSRMKQTRKGRSPGKPAPPIDNYQTPEVENPYSRYDILESLVANSFWEKAWLSDPIAPGA